MVNPTLVLQLGAEYARLPLIPPYLEPGNNEFTYGANFASAASGALNETFDGLRSYSPGLRIGSLVVRVVEVVPASILSLRIRSKIKKNHPLIKWIRDFQLAHKQEKIQKNLEETRERTQKGHSCIEGFKLDRAYAGSASTNNLLEVGL
ncbi:hypothetical protein Tco_0277952 [Tanacetum coccineum]